MFFQYIIFLSVNIFCMEIIQFNHWFYYFCFDLKANQVHESAQMSGWACVCVWWCFYWCCSCFPAGELWWTHCSLNWLTLGHGTIFWLHSRDKCLDESTNTHTHTLSHVIGDVRCLKANKHSHTHTHTVSSVLIRPFLDQGLEIQTGWCVYGFSDRVEDVRSERCGQFEKISENIESDDSCFLPQFADFYF